MHTTYYLSNTKNKTWNSFLTGITIGVEPPIITVNEGNGTIEVCARQTSGATIGRRVNVILSTEDGKATSVVPRDFTAVSLPLRIETSQSKACMNVTIDDDSIVEDEESFKVVVSSTDQNVDVGLSTTTVTILDNDKATIGIEMNQYHGDEGQMTTVCAALNGNVALERQVMVQLSTINATASGRQ